MKELTAMDLKPGFEPLQIKKLLVLKAKHQGEKARDDALWEMRRLNRTGFTEAIGAYGTMEGRVRTGSSHKEKMKILEEEMCWPEEDVLNASNNRERDISANYFAKAQARKEILRELGFPLNRNVFSIKWLPYRCFGVSYYVAKAPNNPFVYLARVIWPMDEAYGTQGATERLFVSRTRFALGVRLRNDIREGIRKAA